MSKHIYMRSKAVHSVQRSAPPPPLQVPKDESKRNQLDCVTEEKPKEKESFFLSWYKHHLKNFFHAVKFPKERKGTSVVNPDDGEEENEYDAGLEKKPMQNKEEPTIVVQAVTLPEISDPSLLLKEQSRRSLYTSLPALVQGRKWVLLYSTWRHGISLSTLYRKSQLWPGLSLLVVGDKKGSVFGGLVEAPLIPTDYKYQGTNNTFVFTDKSGQPTVYHPTGANRFYTLCSKDFLALGGGGRFALYLDSELLHGSSACSETYGNSCLANSQDFDVKEVELWGFVYGSKYDEVLSLSRKTETICRWS
uniref:TLDc domain-containing protein n=1 Tax=Brassica oleracea var. oleracea TaxID=109376 RepID=A0A0D3A115_BRAOL